MELELHAGIPLFVRHLKQIDPRHRACDVQERIDTAQLRQCSTNNSIGRLWRHEIKIDRKHLGAARLDLLGNLTEPCRAPRDQHDSREILGQSDRGRPSYSGACTGYDGHRFQHPDFSYLTRGRKSRMALAISSQWVSSAKWPVSKKRTSAPGMSRLNASAPGGRKDGSFLPQVARQAGLCLRKEAWNSP